ncbi:MAG: hypothetical protein ABIE25_04470 [Thermoplasmatota archaeon]
MIAFSRRVRLILVVVASIDLAVFSEHSFLVVLAQAMGTVLILLGLQSTYRPSALVGLLLTATASASAIDLPSLLEVGQIITAIGSLAIPMFVLTWLALSAEEGESTDVILLKRPAIVALTFALICLFSAPAVILVMSLLAPTTAMRLTPMTEISIMLIVTVVGAIALTRRVPETTTISETREQTQG